MIFIIFLNIVESRRECVARKGTTSSYCVCNITYCDDLEPIVKQNKGTVLLFETNEAGARHKKTELKFSAKHNNSDQIVLTLDHKVKYQKIIGFGGAFTDASGLNLNTLPKGMAENIMKDYYSSSGIEYNMGRVPMAGTDFSTHSYSYDDNSDDFNLTHFKLQSEDMNFKVKHLFQNCNLVSIYNFDSTGNKLTRFWMEYDVTYINFEYVS